MNTRQEHLDWCKQRALEYCNEGDLTNALASMASDLNKHPDTQNHIGIMLGMQLSITGNLSTKQQMEDFINGFN